MRLKEVEQQSGHMDFLGGMRAIAAVWVVVSHAQYLLNAPVLEMVWRYWIPRLGLNGVVEFVCFSALAGVVAMPVAYLFSISFERPFMSRRVCAPESLLSEAPKITAKRELLP